MFEKLSVVQASFENELAFGHYFYLVNLYEYTNMIEW